jgi:hypothetical protein
MKHMDYLSSRLLHPPLHSPLSFHSFLHTLPQSPYRNLPLVALEVLDAQNNNDKVADQIDTGNANISPAMREIHVQVGVEILALGVLAVLASGGCVRVVDVPWSVLEEGARVLNAGLARRGLENAELCITAADFQVIELGCHEALDNVVIPSWKGREEADIMF